MSNQIKIEELSNNRYMINDETIIYAPNIETALTRYESNLNAFLDYEKIKNKFVKNTSNYIRECFNSEKSDNSEEHY